MKKTVPTLEETREARLREGRRKDAIGRLFVAVGLGAASVTGIVLASAVCGRVVPLGKSDLAAGNPSDAILLSWDEATVAFSARPKGGPVVEARVTAIGRGVPSGAEFRVDGLPAGLVFGPPAASIDLRGVRVKLGAAQEVVIRLSEGYRPAVEKVRSGRWAVRYLRAEAVHPIATSAR